MNIKGIDHIGISVECLEETVSFYRDVLGLELLGVEEVPSQKVRVAMFRAGESRIELLEPTSPDSPIAKSIESKGPGLHHIAYSVPDAVAEIKELMKKDVRMIDTKPRSGAGGTRIAFIHPRGSYRVLTEICEHPSDEKEGVE